MQWEIEASPLLARGFTTNLLCWLYMGCEGIYVATFQVTLHRTVFWPHTRVGGIVSLIARLLPEESGYARYRLVYRASTPILLIRPKCRDVVHASHMLQSC